MIPARMDWGGRGYLDADWRLSEAQQVIDDLKKKADLDRKVIAFLLQKVGGKIQIRDIDIYNALMNPFEVTVERNHVTHSTEFCLKMHEQATHNRSKPHEYATGPV